MHLQLQTRMFKLFQSGLNCISFEQTGTNKRELVSFQMVIPFVCWFCLFFLLRCKLFKIT